MNTAKPKPYVLALFALLCLSVFAGCTTAKLGKRTMEIDSPLFKYKSTTENLETTDAK